MILENLRTFKLGTTDPKDRIRKNSPWLGHEKLQISEISRAPTKVNFFLPDLLWFFKIIIFKRSYLISFDVFPIVPCRIVVRMWVQ